MSACGKDKPSDLVSVRPESQDDGTITAVVVGAMGERIALATNCTHEQYMALEEALFRLIP